MAMSFFFLLLFRRDFFFFHSQLFFLCAFSSFSSLRRLPKADERGKRTRESCVAIERDVTIPLYQKQRAWRDLALNKR